MLGLLLVWAAVVAEPEVACTRSKLLCSTSVHWETRQIPYRVRVPSSNTLSEELLLSSITKATATWEAVACSDLRFPQDALKRSAEGSEEITELVPLTSAEWSAAKHAGNALAITHVFYHPLRGTIRRGLIELNAELPFKAVEAECTADYDLEATLTHEVGHLIGLAHPCEYPDDAPPEGARTCPVADCSAIRASYGTDERLPTMWPREATCDTTFRSLEADDVTAVCFVYPKQGSTRQCDTLPESEVYVTSVPFGCSASGVGDDKRPWPWAALFGLGWLWRRRRTAR